MTTDDGRAPSGPGRTAEPEPCSTVSAVPASVPNAKLIPHGDYCYRRLGPMDERGHMTIKGMCPYWHRREGDHAYCAFLDYETEIRRELLWDQVKICGVNDG